MSSFNAHTIRAGLRKTTGRKKRAIVVLLLFLLVVVVLVFLALFQCVRIEVVSSDFEDEEKAEKAGARVATMPCDPRRKNVRAKIRSEWTV
jgi:cell division protein FtsI/penicillin-binding protein 2